MKLQTTVSMALICAAGVSAETASIWSNFSPIASVQLMAEKYLYDTKDDNNLDNLFGRANLGLNYSSPSFDGKLYLRAYPSNFGYAPLAGASIQGDSISVTKSKIDKIQIPEAYVKFKNRSVDVKVGRYLVLLNPRATCFGYYADQGMDVIGGFESRGSVYNALQFSKNVKMNETGANSNSQIDLIVNDDRINNGDLRVSQSFDGLINNKLGVTVAYRGNIFDKINNDNAMVKHSVDAQVYVNVVKPVTVFAEVAKKDFGKDDADVKIDGDTPVMFGVAASIPKVLDYVVAEFQILDKANQDMFLWNLTVSKSFNPHLSFDFGVYSNQGKSDQAALGIFMSSKL